MSTQEAFGRVLGALARRPVGEAIVTVSADVAVTTHLAGWISRKGVYFPEAKPNYFAELAQAVPVEGIAGRAAHRDRHRRAQSLLAAGRPWPHPRAVRRPLLPIGTLYDPFVARGLDALYHALYSGARFIVVATPSGVTLSPEGGAHQSVITPGIGVALPDIVYWEPVFAREVEWILLDALARLGTSARDGARISAFDAADRQGLAPPPGGELSRQVLRGGYRLVDARGEPGWDPRRTPCIVFAAGVMVPEALEAARALRADGVFASVFVVTSPDLLYRGLREPRPYLEELVGADEEGVPIVSVLDGHSHALAFLGGALGVPQLALGRRPLRPVGHARRPLPPLRHRRTGHRPRRARAAGRLTRVVAA